MWKSIAYASAGRGHIKYNIPCQDQVGMYQSDKIHVITLADGAGSAKYSHFGAEAVASFLSKEIGEHFDEMFMEEDASYVRETVMERLLTRLNEVAEEHQCRMIDLASTLLAVGVSGSRYLIFHLGDGVVGYMKDNKIRVASRPDNGEYANETYFTTSENAAKHLKLVKGADKEISGFVIMSDGTENSLYDKRSNSLSVALRRMIKMTSICTKEVLDKMLEESFTSVITQMTQDDCSISILSNDSIFFGFESLSKYEKEDMLMLTNQTRHMTKRLKYSERILYYTKGGKTLRQISESLHIKPKYVKLKLSQLMAIGLLEYSSGIYMPAAHVSS